MTWVEGCAVAQNSQDDHGALHLLEYALRAFLHIATLFAPVVLSRL